MANERVLFVDDDERLLSGLQRQFSDQFTIRIASSGADAVRTIRSEETFAVIISDMRMPGMNGMELLQKAHQISPDSICMMLTGDSEPRVDQPRVHQPSTDPIRGPVVNLFRVLEKPCDPWQLERAIRLAIEQFLQP